MKKTDTQIQRDGRRMLNRLLSYLKPYRRELAFGIFVLAVLAALDTIFPIMLREGIDRFAETGSLEGIWEYVGIYIALIALSTVFVLSLIHICGSYQWRVLRTGIDFRLRCTVCGHEVMIPREKLEKKIRRILRGDTEINPNKQ